jgi:hypothetical protein
LPEGSLAAISSGEPFFLFGQEFLNGGRGYFSFAVSAAPTLSKTGCGLVIAGGYGLLYNSAHPAGVAKSADALDSKSSSLYGECGFDSHLGTLLSLIDLPPVNVPPLKRFLQIIEPAPSGRDASYKQA